MCSHILTFFWHYFYFLFLPFCNWSGECVFSVLNCYGQVFWLKLFIPTATERLQSILFESLGGRWVSQWAEMSTKTHASPNRIQTIKAVSHHYCHCRRKDSFVCAWALQVWLVWKNKERTVLLKRRPKEGAPGRGAFIDPPVPRNIASTDYAWLPISNSAW